jgi:hypothetical protein
MQRYAIIDGINVVNVINYESQPTSPIEGLDPSYIAVQSDVAGPGFTYKNGIFTPPQPYPSWTLVDNVWTPPTLMPTTGGPYMWDELTKTWVTP